MCSRSRKVLVTIVRCSSCPRSNGEPDGWQLAAFDRNLSFETSFKPGSMEVQPRLNWTRLTFNRYRVSRRWCLDIYLFTLPVYFQRRCEIVQKIVRSLARSLVRSALVKWQFFTRRNSKLAIRRFRSTVYVSCRVLDRTESSTEPVRFDRSWTIRRSPRHETRNATSMSKISVFLRRMIHRRVDQDR